MTYADRIEATLRQIEDRIMAIEDSIDIDYRAADGMLEMILPQGSRIIINRQAAVEELWLAARSGGYHLSWRGDDWFCATTGETLTQLLRRVLDEQGLAGVAF